MTPILTKIFSTHGLPLTITTDNGPQFKSQHFHNYCLEHGIGHRKITPIWPQANGEIERQNRSLLKRMRIAQAEKKNWKEEIHKYLFMYRSSPHSTTGISPAELLFGRKIRNKLPELQEYSESDIGTRDRDQENKGKGRIYIDERRKAKPCEIAEGDKVLMKQKQ